MSACLWLFMSACLCVRMPVRACMCLCLCVCLFVCEYVRLQLYARVFVCNFVCISKRKRNNYPKCMICMNALFTISTFVSPLPFYHWVSQFIVLIEAGKNR